MRRRPVDSEPQPGRRAPSYFCASSKAPQHQGGRRRDSNEITVVPWIHRISHGYILIPFAHSTSSSDARAVGSCVGVFPRVVNVSTSSRILFPFGSRSLLLAKPHVEWGRSPGLSAMIGKLVSASLLMCHRVCPRRVFVSSPNPPVSSHPHWFRSATMMSLIWVEQLRHTSPATRLSKSPLDYITSPTHFIVFCAEL
uniref:Uncharacterized protein n=1 Tax=Steinernema glaseri TaxID=37863 RepID=A0A1I7XXJ5_9BILA